MFRNPLLDLLGTRLLVPMVFAYLSALVLTIAGIVRALLASDDSSAEDRS